MPPRFLTDEQMAELEAQQAQQPRKFITDAEMAELEAQYSQDSSTPKMNDLELGIGLGGKILKGLTLGLGDEIIAGGSGLIDYATGKAPSLSDAYSSRKAQVDDILNRYSEERPILAPTAEIGAGFASPAVGLKIAEKASKLPVVGKLLSNALGRGAIAGATEAGIYAGNEGGDVVDSATSGALFGGGLSALSSGVGKALKSVKNSGDALQRSAFGITPNDLRKSEKGIGKYERIKTGSNPLVNSFEAIKKRGEFPKVFEPDALRNKGIAEISSKGNKVTEIISRADEVLDDAVVPSFSRASDYIESLSGTEKNIALEVLKKEATALNSQLDGSLTSLQKAKVAFNKRTYAGSAEAYQKGLDRAITRDLKEAIEGKVNKLTEKGLLKSGYKNEIDKLNRQIGEWESLLEPIQRMESKELANDPVKSLISGNRTSGGFGTLTTIGGGLYGGYQGMKDGSSSPLEGATKGALAGFALQKGLVEPSGRYRLGQIFNKFPNGLGARTDKATSKITGRLGEQFPKTANSVLKGLGYLDDTNQETTIANNNPATPHSNMKKNVSITDIDSYKKLHPTFSRTSSQSDQVHSLYRRADDPSYRKPDYSSLDVRNSQQIAKEQKISSSSKLYPKKMDVSLKSLIDQQDPLVKAIIKQESNFNPRAGSKAGARGLMQIMPFWDDKLGINDPYDPVQNVNAGIEIYNQELDRFKDPVLALASYNAGSPKVLRAIKKAGSRQWSKVKKYLPQETIAYVPKVLKYYREFEGETA